MIMTGRYLDGSLIPEVKVSASSGMKLKINGIAAELLQMECLLPLSR